VIHRPILALLAALLAASAALAAPVSTSTDESVPPVVTDTAKPRQCVIAYLVTDVGTNDIFISRQQVEPAQDEKPGRGRYACPTDVPARVATRALEPCLARAGDLKLCVFGDMARGFENRPDARQTAENTSRCASDLANYIGIACWQAGDRDVCNVACGNTEQEARDQARGRCEVKQQKRCTVTGAAEVLPPQ
jgi:hypothetical protein